MNINANVGLRDRSRITLGGFKGLDTLSAAVDVSAIHATEMKNLISRDGVNHKRFGWKTQFRIRNNGQYLKIQGIFDFTIYHERFLIVYAGKKFWSIDTLNNYQDITESATTIAVIDKTLLTDTECKCYINGNKAYFIGCGDLLVFSKWDNNKFELRRVVGNEDVYIPTTTEDIGSEEDGQHYPRITAEERNMLSPYTYNLLIGVKELPFSVDDKEYTCATYYLDSKDFTDISIEIERQGKSSVVFTTVVGEGNYKIGEYVRRTSINLGVMSYSSIGSIATMEANPGRFWGWANAGEIPSTIDIATTENDGKIEIRNRVEEYSTIDAGWYSNISLMVSRVPSKISYSFYHVSKDGTALRISPVMYTTSTIKVNRVVTSGNSYSAEMNMSINYDSLVCDLSSYNVVLKEIINGSFTNYESVSLKSSEEGYEAEIDFSAGKIVFKAVEGDTSAYCPLVPDVPNIKVKLTRPLNTSIVISASKACEFGAQGGTDRLFIVDNTGNTIRWSKDQDFTYFGEKSWCVCGTSDKSITGMDRLNDSTLLVVKEYSAKEPSIFIITGNITTDDTEARTTDYTALFTPHGYQVGMGAVGDVINFNGDCMMVGKDGLYAVSLGENMTVDSRYVLHRSRQISNKLEKFDLASAKCISFNGKFFVAVGGEEQECYVADNKYTSSFEGDIQNVVNYEWWRWTNIPVNVWGIVENELWFGTEDGQLCCFTDNFYDETFSRLHTGLATYKMEEKEIVGFTFHKDIKVSIGDVFTPTCNFYGGIKTDKFEIVGDETRFYLPLNDYLDGEKIYIDNTAYTITKHDLFFSIPLVVESSELTIYRNYKDKPLTVVDDVSIILLDSSGNSPAWSNTVSSGGLNPSISNFSATLSHKESVVSKWVSGAMDLGTRAYSKTLTYLVLTGEKELANRLKYGLKTRFAHRDYELLRANNDLDFTELDLQTVSMDSNFASSYTKKLNIRNINFLMFYFVSDTAEDVALNSIQIEYKLYKRNIGVR